MQKTIIVITTHRGVSDDTYECAVACQPAMMLKCKGVVIIERARNRAFDLTLKAFEQADAAGVAVDSALFLDDDMVAAKTSDLQRLVDTARATGHPRSARYVTASGALAGHPYPGSNRWGFGLGCMAVPRACLERVAPTLPTLAGDRLWCQVGAHPTWPDAYVGEDLWWCAHFGGVDLDPIISVGHLKTVALFPKGPNGGVRVVALGQKE